MSKREKKLSIPTLNRLNEEDENVGGDAAAIAASAATTNLAQEAENQLNQQKLTEEAKELNKEKQKLMQSINGVFKTVPFCDNAPLLFDDAKRLESLEELLINRLILNNLDASSATTHRTQTTQDDKLGYIKKLSSSQYGVYLSTSMFDDNIQPVNMSSNSVNIESTENVLDLTSLNLTTECVKKFALKNILIKSSNKTASKQSHESHLDKLLTPANEDYLNFLNNSKKVKLINLTKNNLRKLPNELLNLFENLELINLSDNNFESIGLVRLIKFSSLKEINLSNNCLKMFTAFSLPNNETEPNESDNEEQSNRNDYLKQLMSTLFVTIERLDLANNQLKSSNCLIVTKFKNLKYLNLSNNLFQINSNSPDAQLPWANGTNKFKSLLELNLSKNNKLTNNLVNSSQQNLSNAYRSGAAHSIFANNESSLSSSNMSGRNSSRLSSSNMYNSITQFNCLTNLRKLDLSENNLNNMPSDIKDLKYLEELNLNTNNLMFIPNELTELKHLKCLLLSENKINELNDNFCIYSKFKLELIKLDLSNNQLVYETFSCKIGLFENLKELNLSQNSFDTIPNTLPKNLEILNLNKNRVKSLMTKPMSESVYNDNDLLIALSMDEVRKRKSKMITSNNRNTITKVSLFDHFHAKNSQTNADEDHKNEKKLIKENVYDQPDYDQLEQLVQPHVFFLRYLKRLHLSDNNIQEVPSDFGILNSNLEFIDLSFNLLANLSVSLCRGLGNSLKYLDLRSNRIRELTDKIRELTGLEYLNLSHNRLSKLNYELCNDLKFLNELYLNNNNLDSLPSYSPVSSANVINDMRSLNSLADDSAIKEADKSLSSNTYASKTEYNSMSTSKSLNIPIVKSASSTRTALSSSGKARRQFTFNLSNLKKIDLSYNKLNESISFYKIFSQSQNLIEINLSNNKLKHIDFVNTSDKANLAWAIEILKNQKKQLVDEDQVKQLRTTTSKMGNLRLLNLSNNDLAFGKGGFVRMLCDLYKLAPNLCSLVYDQLHGAKLGEPKSLLNSQPNVVVHNSSILSTKTNPQTAPAKSTVRTKDSDFDTGLRTITQAANNLSEDYYFDFDVYENDNDELMQELEMKIAYNDLIRNNKKRNEFYEILIDKLEMLNLSNNNLKNLPKFVYDLKNLKEIYFDGNLLKKIPNEMFKLKQSTLDDDLNFEKLKKLQLLRIKAEEKKRREEAAEEEEEEYNTDYEETPKKKKRGKKKKAIKNEQEQAAVVENVNMKEKVEEKRLLSNTLEVIHFNNNQIEHVPENLFANFKYLKEIKLLNNPLKEPPQESVCITSRFVRNRVNNTDFKLEKVEDLKLNTSQETITHLDLKTANEASTEANMTSIANINRDKKNLFNQQQLPTFKNEQQTLTNTNLSLKRFHTLPNLFFETNENLIPLQSYMIKYKNREDMLLCNMFLMVKDNIESTETLMKLMRRLKMPMDRVNYVCKEINDSVVKNWRQIASVEYPPEPGKMGLTRKELSKKMTQYILRLQTWNLLNAWRNTFGVEAQSDELIRIFKLMNSNKYENDLCNKLISLKMSSNMLKV